MNIQRLDKYGNSSTDLGPVFVHDKFGKLKKIGGSGSGADGPQGPQGPDNGPQGFQGPQGVQGAQGYQGFQGDQGDQGTKGDQGPKGDQGNQGPQGLKGDQGYQGDQGPKGDQGFQGNQGPQGLKGDQGYQGDQGPKGYQGPKGDQGFQGPQGVQGLQGTQGNQGVQGTQGNQGKGGISAGAVYYFNQSQSSDVSPYKVLTTQPNGVQQILPINLTGSQLNVLVQQFLTPQLSFAVIPGGTQRFHLHYLKPAENDHIEAYVTIQLANSAGTAIGPIIVTGNSLIGWVDASTPAEVLLDLTLPTTGIDPTNRMIAKLYLSNYDSTAHTATWYTEGTSYYSFVITTVGVIGNEGAQGPQGVQGLKGDQGNQGVQGTQGVQGGQGPQGVQGGQGPQGVQGVQGTQGVQGILGNFGGDSVLMTTVFNYSSGFLSAGLIAFNGTLASNTTQLQISITDSQGGNITNWNAELRTSTSTIKGYLRISVNGSSNIYAIYRIDSGIVSGGYELLNVTYISGNGTISTSSNVVVSFSRTGDTGTQGPQGVQGTGTQGFQGPQGVQGVQGNQGTGTQGPQGFQGVQGNQGTGTQGIQGVQGNQGTGTQGPQGFQGVQGNQGTGTQGPQGFQGVQGNQGTTASLSPSNYVVKAVKGGSGQTIPNATDTVITFVDEFDPQNWWTPSKFQPTIAGYYNIQLAVWWNPASITSGQNNIQLRLNGSTQVAIQQTPLMTGDGYGQEIDIITYFNGSTDYLEATAYTGNTTSQTINGASSGTWFTASLLTNGVGPQGPQGVAGSGGGGGTSNIRRHDFASPYDYNGYAPTGSAESSTVWTITRLTVAADGSTTVGTATSASWTNRATTTYI